MSDILTSAESIYTMREIEKQWLCWLDTVNKPATFILSFTAGLGNGGNKEKQKSMKLQREKHS